MNLKMNLELYLAMKDELNLRVKGEVGKLFSNQTTEQIKQLIKAFDKEIALYAMIKALTHFSKFERCEV